MTKKGPSQLQTRTKNSSDLTIVVISSPIASNPSTKIIAETLRSFSLLELGGETEIRILLDGLKFHQRFGGTASRYHEYMRNLEEFKIEFPGIRIIPMKKWGHISQTLKRGLTAVTSEFCLVVQHDMPFICRVNISELVEQMKVSAEVKHVRFNLRRNIPEGADAWFTLKSKGLHIDRREFFTEWISKNGGSEVKLVKTLCWSDNNHLCRTSYLKETILRPIGDARIAPEWAMNRLGMIENHKFLGTYVFGSLGDSPVIGHSDGKNYLRSTNRRLGLGSDRKFWTYLRVISEFLAILRTEFWRFRHELVVSRIVRRATNFFHGPNPNVRDSGMVD